jgi:predicted outer membrane repeat protein
VNATPKVISCIFNGNSANSGGGMSTFVNYAHLTVANCIFANNSVTVFGGGIVGSDNMDITNCTFSGNSALSGGGAIYTNHDSPIVTNCILWGDTPNEIYWIGGAPIVNHSDVQGGWGGGTGIKDVNPLFVDAANGDFHLQPLSQCINSGDNAAPSLPDSDFEGHLRKYPSGGTVDMGADEYVPLPSDVWVDDDWVGTIPGMGVDGHLFGYDAFDHIQTGINLVALSGTVHVAEGTYTENIDFKGKDITVKSENGAALTTIDGCAAGTVVTFDDGETSGAVLDGFTITNGNGFTGGGIYCSHSSPTIINNIITENHAFYLGGGIYVCYITNPLTIKGCTITENSAGLQGGGIGCHDATLTLRNVTISGNSAQWGGGIFAHVSTALTLENTIVAFSARGEAVLCNDPGSTATLTCCNVYGNAGGDYVGSIAGQGETNNNISEDPLFCDGSGDDYSLHSNSTCAEENNPLCGQIGSELVLCGPTTFYVKHDNTGDFERIQTAIDEVPTGSVIQLDEGTYTGTGNRDLDFRGKALTLRGLINNPEECQIDCQGSPTSQRRGFYFHSNEGADSVVEGILIKNGYVDVGGGILCENSSPTLNNVYFSRNQATDDGGGLACVDHASPTLSGCFFDYCEVGDDGGGLYAYDWSSPMLNDCIFRWNEAADRGGGALFVVNSFPELTGCVFYGNTGMNGGGACFVYAEGPMTDCLFYDNTATFGGGLQCYGNAQCILTRCTFSGNGASSGGGLYCRNNSSPSLHNSIIAFSTQGQAVARQANDCNPTLACSNLYDNAGGDWVGCIAGQAGTNGNISKNPLFCNVTYKNFALHELNREETSPSRMRSATLLTGAPSNSRTVDSPARGTKT